MSTDIETRWNDPVYLEDLGSDRGHTDVAADWPWTEATVRRDRARLRRGKSELPISTDPPEVSGKVDVDPEGGKFTNIQTDEPITDWGQVFKQFKLDPQCFHILNDTVRMSKWQQSRRLDNGDRDTVWLYSYSASFVRTTAETEELFRSLVSELKSRDFPTAPKRKNTGLPQFFIPGDQQLGKVDRLGGTASTVEAFYQSLQVALQKASESRPEEIIIVDTGDITEGFSNVSSQHQTSDLTLTQEIELAFRLLHKAISSFVALGFPVRFVSVPSNHCQVKVGKQQLASTPNDDYGILLNKQLELVYEGQKGVTFVRPDNDFSETSTFSLSDGTKIAVVHGHQTGSADKIGNWWKGQDHGRLPAWDASILITGHWHSFKVSHSGDARWVIVAPALEPSSAWFENLKGEQSKRGALHFTVKSGQWYDLEIA